MDKSEEDSIFTFSVHYEDTEHKKSYDETPAILVDKDRMRIEPFKKLPVLVEDSDLDVGDLIIHNYGNKTPGGTLRLNNLKKSGKEECGLDHTGENEVENETCADSIADDVKTNIEENDVVPKVIVKDSNGNNDNKTGNTDELVELDSSYATNSDNSQNSTPQNKVPPAGQLLGGNADSLSLDFSLADTDCDFHQTSLSTGLLARSLPAPRFIAHQMALSISPERYIPKARPKSNRYSISSSSPSDDGSQFELWATRKRTSNSKLQPTKCCIGILVAILIVIILCIVIVPVVWIYIRPTDVAMVNIISNSTTESFTDIHNFTSTYDFTTTSEVASTTTNHITTTYEVTSAAVDRITTTNEVSSAAIDHITTTYEASPTTASKLTSTYPDDVTSTEEVIFTTDDSLTVSTTTL